MIPLDRETVSSEYETEMLDAAEPSEVRRRSPAAIVAREIVQTFVLAIFLAFVLRFFFIDTYLIDGPSMEPSLHEGERLLVSKISYRLRRPVPGEVVVFGEPGRDGRSLVKRIVAVEGQTLEIRRGRVVLNGEEVAEDYIANPGNDSLPPQRIPAGAVFVMGDNRSNSWDSRYFGTVSVREIRGNAFLVFWPPDSFHRLGDGGSFSEWQAAYGFPVPGPT